MHLSKKSSQPWRTCAAESDSQHCQKAHVLTLVEGFDALMYVKTNDGGEFVVGDWLYEV